jgi:hypothetical protein
LNFAPTPKLAQSSGATANPVAQQGESLYYVHSKTAYYNSFFVEFWDELFVKNFSLNCPFYNFFVVLNLGNLLNAKIERYTFWWVLNGINV